MFLTCKFLLLLVSQRFASLQLKRFTESLVDTSDGGISIGVRTEQATSAFNEGMEYVTFVIGVGHEAGTTQKKRVVSNKKTGPKIYGFLGSC